MLIYQRVTINSQAPFYWSQSQPGGSITGRRQAQEASRSSEANGDVSGDLWQRAPKMVISWWFSWWFHGELWISMVIFMVISWWVMDIYGDLMVIWWWVMDIYGDLMVIWWWVMDIYGDLMVIWWWVMDIYGDFHGDFMVSYGCPWWFNGELWISMVI